MISCTAQGAKAPSLGFISPCFPPQVDVFRKLRYAKSAMADFWKTRAALAERDCGSVRAALCQGKQSDVSEKLRCIRNLELRQKNLWFSWRNLLSENLSCMWSLLLCVDGEFDLRRRLLGSSCCVCMHHAHKHSQCNLFAFVLFVIAKIIGLVVLCFRYQ